MLFILHNHIAPPVLTPHLSKLFHRFDEYIVLFPYLLQNNAKSMWQATPALDFLQASLQLIPKNQSSNTTLAQITKLPVPFCSVLLEVFFLP